MKELIGYITESLVMNIEYQNNLNDYDDEIMGDSDFLEHQIERKKKWNNLDDDTLKKYLKHVILNTNIELTADSLSILLRTDEEQIVKVVDKFIGENSEINNEPDINYVKSAGCVITEDHINASNK
jgi:hypothetical protein